MPSRPLLLVDVDGVISLFGFDPAAPPPGSWHMVDGIAHLVSGTAGVHLRALSERFDLAWCSGWEEKANEYLPLALGLNGKLAYVELDAPRAEPSAHWKLAAIDAFAGRQRPLAWIDDSLGPDCEAWSAVRPGRTLLLATDPAVGLTADHVAQLLAWAASLDQVAVTE